MCREPAALAIPQCVRTSFHKFWISTIMLLAVVAFSKNESVSDLNDWIDDGFNNGTELVELWGNHDTFLKIHCQSVNRQLVIIEAYFTCKEREGFRNEHNIRHYVNKRCSGKNLCSFILDRDCPSAKAWGNGTVYMQYACINEKDMIKTCTANVSVELNEEGFIETPGYPRYYVGGRICRWTLHARNPNVQVQLRFMDIALRSVGPLENQCRDWLIVNEHGLDMLATCGDPSEDIIITSTGPEVNITLTTASVNLFPKRGLLIHYQADANRLNCEGPEPRGAHLVVYNATHAQYRCSIENYVFAETGSRDLIISCRYHQQTVAHCVVESTMNATRKDVLAPMGDISSEIGGLYSDVIVPCIVLGLLLIANAVLVGIIFVHKKRLLAGGGDDPWIEEPLQERPKQFT